MKVEVKISRRMEIFRIVGYEGHREGGKVTFVVVKDGDDWEAGQQIHYRSRIGDVIKPQVCVCVMSIGLG